MTDQEKEDQFFEERGNMIVGEEPSRKMKIVYAILSPFLWVIFLVYRIIYIFKK